MKLENIIKQFNGIVVTFNIEDKYYKQIEKNKNVSDIWVFTKNSDNKKFIKQNNDNSKISAKKIYKVVKHADYVIIDIKDIYKYLDNIMYTVSKICKNKLYIIGKIEKYQMDYLVKKYKRHYNIIYENNILEVNLNPKKNTYLKPIYYIYDILYNIIDKIGNLIMN